MSLPQYILDQRKQIVDDVCDALKNGTEQWRKTWEAVASAPENAVTGKRYRGGNAFSLAFYGTYMDNPDDNRWCTLHQANSKGWKIKKGSKGHRVTFFEISETSEKSEEETPNAENEAEARKRIIAKQYTVFHASQIEGIPPLESKKEMQPFEKVEKAERILAESGAVIKHGGNEAYYRPQGDYIQLPHPESFIDNVAYYATAHHELAHWTGHSSRLNRDVKGFWKAPESYAKEELIAELTSMFLGGETGLNPAQGHFDNHAAYISSWISALEKDPNELFRAAAQADKAANFILQHEHEREKKAERAKGIGKGADEQKTKATEREVRDLNLLPNAKIYTQPSENGMYKGEILHVDSAKGYCVQQVGKTSLVVHKNDDLACVPQEGENVRVSYKANEKARVVAHDWKQERQQAKAVSM